jgi:hypothetical protein
MTSTVFETCSIVWFVSAEIVTVSLIAGVGDGVGADCCAKTLIVKKQIKLNIFIIFIFLLFRPARKLVNGLTNAAKFQTFEIYSFFHCCVGSRGISPRSFASLAFQLRIKN